MRFTSCRLALLLIILLIGIEREAKGYTDPGTGALIWQVLIAGFMGAMFYFRRIKNYILSFRNKQRQDR
jgi:hypothetical protein